VKGRKSDKWLRGDKNNDELGWKRRRLEATVAEMPLPSTHYIKGS